MKISVNTERIIIMVAWAIVIYIIVMSIYSVLEQQQKERMCLRICDYNNMSMVGMSKSKCICSSVFSTSYFYEINDFSFLNIY